MEIIRKTIINDEPYLRQISKDVDFKDKSYLEDIKKLKEFCQSDGIFALAPIQIGIPKRIIYLRSTKTELNTTFDHNYDESRVLINPTIIKRRGLTTFLESCASCPDGSIPSREFKNEEKFLAGIVKRPYLIEVEYYDIEGNNKIETFKGFESTVLQHEYDHLNGILHIDLADEVWSMDYIQRKEYRDKHPYQIISEDYDYDKEFVQKKYRK